MIRSALFPALLSIVSLWTLAAACTPHSASPPPATPATAPQGGVPGGQDPQAKLTVAQCQQALDHVLAFPAETDEAKKDIEAMKANRQQMVEQCQQSGTQKDYDCLMASKTFTDLGKCEEPGQ
jgi:hypothetical protein